MKNINIEVEAISIIFELVKLKNYKYSDIKIVVSSVDDYRSIFLENLLKIIFHYILIINNIFIIHQL